MELMNLGGRKALVTGAAGSIGHQIAITIAELGGQLILVDHPDSDFSLLRNKLEEFSTTKAEFIKCDLENKNERLDLIESINKNCADNLTILVNNAAFGGDSKLNGWIDDLEGQTIETWCRAIEVNLTAAFDLSKGLYKNLGKNQNGSIINIGSIYGSSGPRHALYEGTKMGNPAAYAASKGGLIQLTKWLATTIAPNVRVNSVSPGGVLRGQPDSFVEAYTKNTPLQRMGTEEDIKGVIAYLVSDLSSYVTGQNIIVDGGWTSW